MQDLFLTSLLLVTYGSRLGEPDTCVPQGADVAVWAQNTLQTTSFHFSKDALVCFCDVFFRTSLSVCAACGPEMVRCTCQESGWPPPASAAEEAPKVSRVLLEVFCIHSAGYELCIRTQQGDLLVEYSRILDRLLPDATMPIPSITRDELCVLHGSRVLHVCACLAILAHRRLHTLLPHISSDVAPKGATSCNFMFVN